MFPKSCLIVCLSMTLLIHTVRSTMVKIEGEYFDIDIPETLDSDPSFRGDEKLTDDILLTRLRRATAQHFVASPHASDQPQQQTNRGSRYSRWQRYNAIRSGGRGQVLDA
ncbi:uncharacterized protein LOC131952318 [Physella acuta]|uniref:uncharacterized protein LOC131952318 n=1 Tax=Physella acuta TaxID=109671 RepID=UPI0027DABFC6|nr:uncharacterized protein LOC131952318 [Physella acuta]